MKYRLTFDVTHPFISETGWTRSVPLQHFRPDERSFENTYREPTTGVVMLKPSMFNVVSDTEFTDFDNFRKTSTAWQKNKRDAISKMGTNILPAGGASSLLEITIAIGIIAILASVAAKDNLVWALESNFSLLPDESFTVHYNSLSDSFNRKYNWMGIQWDNVFIHIATTGKVRVYRYEDRADLTQTPILFQEFSIAAPGDLTSRDGMFWFLPIPGIGLVMQHSFSPQESAAIVNTSKAQASKSVLIPLPWHPIGDSGNYRMFEASPIRFALNPYQKYVFGMERVRFEASGSFVDAPFDPGYQPSGSPTVEASIIPTGFGSATATARKADNSGAYVGGTDRKGRIKVTFTGSGVHTPFLTNYVVSFASVANSRNPGSHAPTKLLDLEYSYDEWERFEGRATVLMQGSALKQIARRGDATFLLEKSTDGVSWSTVDGGIATDWQNEYISLPIGYGHHVKATCALQGMHYRLNESHIISESAFDGNTVGQAINSILRERGFAGIDWTGTPHDTVTFQGLTAQENTWKYAPKIGEGGWETIQKILFNVRRQNREYYIKYNWTSQLWESVQKARDLSTSWRFVNDSSKKDAGNRKQRYATLRGRPRPPEANEIVVVGLTPGVKVDLSAPGIAAYGKEPVVARNADSITDSSSLGYLGRVKRVIWAMEEAGLKGDVAKSARRVLDAVGYTRELYSLTTPDYQSALYPNVYIEIWDDTDAVISTGWIKRITVKASMNDREWMEIETDSVWAGELP